MDIVLLINNMVEAKKEIKNGQHDGMMPGRDRDPSTQRTVLIATSNK